MFVSQFVGSPSINLITANIENKAVIVNGEKICESKLENQDIILGARPENTIIKEKDNMYITKSIIISSY